MTTPGPPDGAFVIGGGDTKYGQDLTESQIRAMFTVPNPLNGNPLEMLADQLSKLPLEVLQMFRGLIPDPLLWVWDTVDGAVDAIMHALTTPPIQLLKELADELKIMWDQFSDLVQGLIITPINGVIGAVADWFGGLGEALEEGVKAAESFADGIWSGIKRVLGIGKSPADVANAANELSEQSEKARDLGEWNNAILGVRQNKHIMSGIDETEESTFLMSDLFNSGATPPFMNVTSSAVPIAFWRAAEWAKKGFISWFGEGFANITGMFIDIYKMNFNTNTMVLLHSSADISGLADTTWKYMVYYLPEANRFEVFPGDVIGIGLRVTGSGTHKVAAKSAPWLPAHPTAVPAKPSATRTGVGDLAFGSITYSNDLPWFGIGIVSGDTPPLFFTPRPINYSTAGTHTYTIPDWAKYLDVTLIGAGGGGHGGNGFGQGGEGGDAGSWASETLERGVDFPTNATSITLTVGAGGTPGTQNSSGGAGAASTRAAIASGKAVFTAAGGPGGNAIIGSSVTGDGAGNHTYGGTTYIGGGPMTLQPAKSGRTGNSPGGGGAGGSGGPGISWWGGPGGSGGAWVTARQS